MEQGDIFSEGISLRDDSYDGQGSKWDRGVDPMLGENSNNENAPVSQNSFQIIHRPESDFDFSYDGENPTTRLTGGLGQLTDTIEGANSFTIDIGYGLGEYNYYLYSVSNKYLRKQFLIASV